VVYVWLNREDGLCYTTELDNPQLLELFGTDTLPTPYGERISLETVLTTLKARNPERTFHYCQETPAMKNLFDPKRYETKEALLEVCILHTLKDGEHFSFDLNKKVERRLHDCHVLTPGKLEPVLKKLTLEHRITREEKLISHLNKRAPFYELMRWGAAYLQEKVDTLCTCFRPSFVIS
jgi:hypothetical protein